MQVNLSKLLTKAPILPKRTKMTCTIGPASDNVEIMKQLLANGLNVCRINFSHDTHEIHYNKLKRIREAIDSNPLWKHTAIMLDTKGPEIRTGFLATPKIELKKGNKVVLTSDYTFKGTPERFALSYEHLSRDVKIGSKILLADGNLSLKVIEINQNDKTVVCEILNDFLLGEKKNVNLPGVKVDLPVIAEKDRVDLIDWGLKHEVDMIALSFTRTPKCVQMCKEVLGDKGKRIKIIPKIENEEGLENLDGIMKVADGVMIARGDLGMEMEPSKLFLAQNYITEVARKHGKPVVMATQMLESMTGNSRPTRAEITDVSAAVWAFNDCTMLSGETGNGKFPVESVKIMGQIARETEFHIDYKKAFLESTLYHGKEYGLAKAAVEAAHSADCKLIIAIGSEDLAYRLCALRPDAIIIHASNDPVTLRGLQLNFGYYGLELEHKDLYKEEEAIKAAKLRAEELGLGKLASKAVFVSGPKKSVRLV